MNSRHILRLLLVAGAFPLLAATQTLTLTSSPNPSTVGQSVTLSASQTPTVNATVTFFDGANALGTAAMGRNGTATFATSSLSVGTHSLTASYQPAKGATVTSNTVTQTVNGLATSLALAASPSPASVCQPVTLTATVSGTPGAAPPTGSVTFTDGGANLGTATLTGGSATITVKSFAAGAHALTATYSGDNIYSGNSGTTSLTVTLAATSTSLSAAPNPSNAGQLVTLTAAVTGTCGTPGGTVTFLDGTATLGAATLTNGSATLSTSALAVGSHSLIASYGGDTNDAASTSAAVTQAVNSAGTTTSLSSSPNPSTAGQAVTFTATVTGGATGTVTFAEGSTTLGTGTLTNGTATFTTSSLSVGSHSVIASYGGDSTHGASTSSAVTQVVNSAGTTTSLTSSPNPSTAGQAVTFTATVTGGATGTITFAEGSTTLGTGTLTNGTATFTTSSLSVGSHSVTASYGGDSTHGASTSSAVTQVVNSAGTTTSLTSSPNPSTAGQAVTFTATVAPAGATGTVTFTEGSTTLGTGTLANGTTTFNTSSLSVGSHSVTASYGGDNTHGTSTSSAVTQVVNSAGTTVTLASSPNPSAAGQAVTFTATVTGGATGTVTFADGTTTLGTGTLTNGTATFTTSSLAVGSHSVTASYGGDSTHTASTSNAVTQAVNKIVTTTALSTAPNPSAAGQQVTLRATVAPAGAAGTVTFSDAGTPLGTAPVNNGQATLAIATLAVGDHSITATYGGDASHAASTSAAVTQSVGKTATTTTLTSTPNPSNSGQTITLTATVAPADAGGTITFLDGSTVLGTAPVSNGTAALTTSALTTGSHELTAAYSGDTAHAPSTSQPVTQNVSTQPSTTTLAAAPNPATFGDTVTLTASVSPASATGTVTFKDGSATLGTATVANGSASTTVASLAPGTHSLTASFSGGGGIGGSTSSAVSLTVNKASTSLTLNLSPNPPGPGQQVTLTTTVSPAAATGSVTFTDNGTSLGSAALTGGTATLRTTLANGSHSLAASYAGDSSFNGSNAPAVTVNVSKQTSTTTLTVTPNPATGGTNVNLTAVVAPAGATGTVTFRDGSTSIGTAQVVNGAATFGTSALGQGSHSLSASYAGDSALLPSTSSPVVLQVNTGRSTTFLSASPTSASPGDKVTLTATITPSDVSGTVSFRDGSSVIGSADVIGGIAILILTNLAPGNHSLTASYNGDPLHTGSASDAVVVSIGLSKTTTTLTASSATLTFGQTVTFTAHVSPAGAGGSVKFEDGTQTLGTANLSGGAATFSTSALTGGGHTITAVYQGDATNATSTSSVVTVTVSKAASSIVLTAAPNPANAGQPVTLTASITPAAAGGTVTFLEGPATLAIATIANGTATATVSALTAGTHSIVASYAGDVNFSGSTSAAVPENVGNGAGTLSISAPASLPGGTVGVAYPSQTFKAAGGNGTYTWSLLSPGTTTSDLHITSAGVLTGTPQTAGSFQVVVQVQDGSSPPVTASKTFNVTFALAPLPGITLSVPTQPTSPADQPVPQLAMAQAYPVALRGTFTLSFTPNAAGLPADYSNPGIEFAGGGTTAQLTLPANSTAPVALPAVQIGTVAGTINVRLTALTTASGQTVPLPAQPPAVTITVPRIAPVIVPGSVKITNVTATGFQLTLDASSTPRDLTRADVAFTSGSGSQLTGTQTFTVDLTSPGAAWFPSAAGLAAGGAFSVQISFGFAGDTTALGTASVTLTNSVGTSSAVSGGR